jgi:hypothetical protein
MAIGANRSFRALCDYASPATIAWRGRRRLALPGDALDVDIIFRQTFDPKSGRNVNNQQCFDIICGASEGSDLSPHPRGA